MTAAAVDRLHPALGIQAGNFGIHPAAVGTDRSFHSASIPDRCWFPVVAGSRCHLADGRTPGDFCTLFLPPVGPA